MRNPLVVSVVALMFLVGCGESPETGPAAASSSEGSANEKSPIGVNLDFNDYWSVQWPWVDVMKMSGDWLTGNESWIDNGQNLWDTQVLDKIPRDNNGYPLSLPFTVPGTEAPQIVHTLMMRVEGPYPAGEYVCLYDGEGTIDFDMDAAIVSQTPGRIVLQVTPSAEGIHLRITKSVNGNHIRNIRVIMPGFEAAYAKNPWHPKFLERLKPFKVLRMVLFMKTLWTTQSAWENRPTATYYSQGTERGVALESMVDLANRLKADPWFCLPHMATDDYVTKFAILVRDNLDPNLKCYVEYSNETWNNLYSVHDYAKQKGLALGLSPDPYEAVLRFTSQRAVEIFEIWKTVFGGKTNRFVRVLASQASWPWTAETVLDWKKAYEKADVLAIAPYFRDPFDGAQAVTMTVDQILDACEGDIQSNIKSVIADNFKIAKDRGLPLVAYEGGQHLVGVGGWEDNSALTSLYVAANRHPRMKDLYRKYLDQWKALGGRLFNHHSFVTGYGMYGSWGLLERQDQDPSKAYKWQAVLEFIEKNPKWW